MNITLHLRRLAPILPALAALHLLPSTGFAQGTAFTYQGKLNAGTNPTTGLFDFQFALYNAGTGGAQVGSTLTNTAVGVTNGLFTTALDFGPVFAGSPAWLAIGVRTNGATGFTALAPLQELTPTPYAISAESAGGIAGIMVQLNANGAPNLIGGSPVNFAAAGVIGATIGGGGATNITQGPHTYHYTNSVTGDFGTVGGGAVNSAALAATVSGGEYNTAGGQYATVAGGYGNSASGGFAVVGGGEDNVASGDSYGDTTVAGGFQNVAGADDATVGGGFNNQATNTFATVPGGTENVAGGQFSFAAGNQAEALHGGAFVWSDGEGTPFASTTTNQFSVRANGGVRFVTSGAGLTVDGVPMPTNSAVLSLFSNPGSGNLFAGQNAGNPAVSGYGDIAVGGGALEYIGTGSDNAAAGVGALEFNTAGSYNAGFGTYALEWNSTGSYNTASGFYALSAQGGTYVTGNGNTADGAYSLYSIETGSNNVAIGFGTLQYALSDNGEVAVGYQALQNVAGSGGGFTIGYANTGIGYQALQEDTYGSDNTALGYQALNNIGAGDNNLALGTWALLSNNGGQNNTAVGTYAFAALTSGSGNIAVGEGAGSGLSSGNNNIYIGSPAGGNENNVIRIGSGQTQTFLSGTSLAADLNVDPNGLNIGNVNSNAVTFGSSSGEGICSKRGNGAANRYDLELWTDFNERLKVAQGGNVGIGTDNPQQPLEVNGNYVLIDGGGAGDGDGPIDAYIGGNGGGSDVQIGSMNSSITAVGFWNTAANAYMHIYCSSITIEGGSDLAEPFQITPTEQPVAEGDVVVIDDAQPGRLKLTDQPYDTRVAGVVSGANGIHPGIQMQQQGLLEGGRNVALTGRVYVQADASNGAIKPGDLLTTSATPGRAMRVTDHARAQGAILGKAMSALPEGRGMVLVLVTLQ